MRLRGAAVVLRGVRQRSNSTTVMGAARVRPYSRMEHSTRKIPLQVTALVLKEHAVGYGAAPRFKRNVCTHSYAKNYFFQSFFLFFHSLLT